MGGGLQGLRPGQNSPAFSGAEHVDIPVRSGGLQCLRPRQNLTVFGGAEHGGGLHGFRQGQFSSTSFAVARSADESLEGGIFRSAGSGQQVHGHSSSSELCAHQMARAGVAAHCEPEEEAARWVDEDMWVPMPGWPGRWLLFLEDIFWDEPGLPAAG